MVLSWLDGITGLSTRRLQCKGTAPQPFQTSKALCWVKKPHRLHIDQAIINQISYFEILYHLIKLV